MAPRPKAQLHVVTSRANCDARDPEDLLPQLFARERALTNELAEVRRQLNEQRMRYSLAHGLCIYVGLDRLRDLFGPKVGR